MLLERDNITTRQPITTKKEAPVKENWTDEQRAKNDFIRNMRNQCDDRPVDVSATILASKVAASLTQRLHQTMWLPQAVEQATDALHQEIARADHKQKRVLGERNRELDQEIPDSGTIVQLNEESFSLGAKLSELRKEFVSWPCVRPVFEERGHHEQFSFVIHAHRHLMPCYPEGRDPQSGLPVKMRPTYHRRPLYTKAH